MADGNGLLPAKRRHGVIQIVWDPNTGMLKMDSSNMNPMEELGVLELAAHTRRNALSGVQPAGRIEIAAPLPLRPGG